MKEPVADITLLVLLILFFGVQQQRRPQLYFRYWTAGWIFVLFAYLVWMTPVHNNLLAQIAEAARFDLMYLGLLTFLVSFLSAEPHLRSTLKRAAMMGLPVLLVIDTRKFFLSPRPLLLMTMVLWQAVSIWATRLLVPVAQLRRRRAMVTVSVAVGISSSIYVWNSAQPNLEDFALSQLLVLTAMLYWSTPKKWALSSTVGTLGFMLWAASYTLSYCGKLPSDLSDLVGVFWNFPKYFVGFSMILRVFEEVSLDKSKLVEQYRVLYEDFRLMFESHVHPMWICESADERILSANTSAILQYGYSEAEFKRMAISDLREPEAQEDHHAISACMQHRRRDGSHFWVEMTTSWVGFQGRDARLVMGRDVTHEKQRNDHLFHRANHDVLTGLPNRALLEDRLRQCHIRCQEEGWKMMLLTVDVDHFKSINDTFGHKVGDECLKAVAVRLKRGIRDIDTLARTGGEEFTAVIGGIRSRDAAEKVVAAFLKSFQQPLSIDDQCVAVTVSIGVALYPDDADSIARVLQVSDEALYAAKRAGRNRAVFAEDRSVQMPDG